MTRLEAYQGGIRVLIDDDVDHICGRARRWSREIADRGPVTVVQEVVTYANGEPVEHGPNAQSEDAPSI